MSEIKINLPETSFPMKANLPTKEPEILKFWEEINLYQELRSNSKGREKFILHDGPPYANGHIHIGTALNKILKDIVVRFNQMTGKDAPYVPGWDCHGLPIEWKVEEEYKKKGKIKTLFQLMNSEKNVENLQQDGSRFKIKNLID
jgi:isoleucyl-tRNA synthetase